MNRSRIQNLLKTMVLCSVFAMIIYGCNESTTPVTKLSPMNGVVIYQSNKVIATGAELIINGKTFDNEANISENKLVGIKYNNKYYIFFTGIKDKAIPIDDKITKNSIANYVAQNYINNSITKKGNKSSLQSYQWELTTGLGIDKISEDHYNFSNFKFRWAAVDNSKEIKYLAPKTFIKWSFVDWNNIIGLNIAETKTIPYEEVPYKTYGSVIPALATPSFGSLIDMDNLKKAYNENPDLVMRLNAVEFFDIMVDGIEQIVGTLPDGNCLDATLFNFIYDTFRSIGFDLLIGKEAAKEAMAGATEDFLNEAIVCVISVAGAEAGAPILEEFISVLSSLAWVGQMGIGSWDAATSKYYAEFQPSQSCNLSIEVSPTGSQSRKVGETSTYNITVKDQNGNPVNRATVVIEDRVLEKTKQKITNGYGIATYTVNCDKVGTFNNTFQAMQTGYNSSLQVNRELSIISVPIKLSLSIEVSPSGSQSKKVGETLTYNITVKDEKGNPVDGATVVIEDRVLGKTKQKISDSQGIASYTVSCNKVGSFNNTFQAMQSGYNSSLQISKQLTITAPQSNLSIEVSPSGSQSKKVGETLTYNITVKDQNGNPVNGATIAIGDGVLGSTQQRTTNSSGMISYTVSCNKAGTFYNTFQALKTGSNSSSQISRQLTITAPQSNLSIEVSPTGSQSRKVGESLTYDITVKDQNGFPISGSTVTIWDDVLRTNQYRTTNSSGMISYTVSCNKAGTFYNTFQALKTGSNSSDMQTRTLFVTPQNKDLKVTVSPQNQNLKGGDFYSFKVMVTCEGQPVQGVSISNSLPWGPSYNGTTGSDGIPKPDVSNWRVPGDQSTGNYKICFYASKSGYNSSSGCGYLTISAPGKLYLNYKCPPSPEKAGEYHSISFAVTDETGVRVQGAKITVTIPWCSNCYKDLISDANGNASYSGQVPSNMAGVTGIYYFYARKDGFTNSSKYSCVVDVSR
ncbi:hypothetical protein ACFLSQ_09880 [Bacteroidota bacterium]